jgi:hypothetical protein
VFLLPMRIAQQIGGKLAQHAGDSIVYIRPPRRRVCRSLKVSYDHKSPRGIRVRIEAEGRDLGGDAMARAETGLQQEADIGIHVHRIRTGVSRPRVVAVGVDGGPFEDSVCAETHGKAGSVVVGEIKVYSCDYKGEDQDGETALAFD